MFVFKQHSCHWELHPLTEIWQLWCERTSPIERERERWGKTRLHSFTLTPVYTREEN